MTKLKFQFEVVASEDPKTNIIIISSITTENNQQFQIPQSLNALKHHARLTALPEFKKVTTTLKKRGQSRSVWFNLSNGIENDYIDESGNIAMGMYLLEEVQIPKLDENSIKILEQLAEQKKENTAGKNPNLHKIFEKFVIEKFTGKNLSANQWLTTYENECERLDVTKDAEKIEMLRLFLEDNCKDWHSSMLIKHTINSEWKIWKDNFLETFADKGWSPILHAINYRFLNGSLLDYALKKERLLLETNKNIDKITVINLIAAGLPEFVREKIDREELKNSQDLFNELRRYEKLPRKKFIDDYKNAKRITRPDEMRNIERRPCKICERKGKTNRYHPENLCWYKTEKNNVENQNLSTNTILEVELNNNQKN